MSCPITFDQLIREHLEFGWQRLKQTFKSDRRIAKARVLRPGDRAVLSLRMVELLTAARTFLVEYLFQCYNRNRFTTYTAFGSTALFSDYDITLLGENAPELMLQMFYRFVEHYGNTLASAFDTNLYCTGYFSSRNSRSIPESRRIANGLLILQPVTPLQEWQCLSFAALKLPLSTNRAFQARFPLVYRLMVDGRSFQTSTEAQLARVELPVAFQRYSRETQALIRRYTMYARTAKRLYQMLYRSGRSESYFADELFVLACRSNYYAIEAYYTPCTVNVVVLESQAKQKLPLRPIEYVCAAIENVGEWVTHHTKFKNEKNVPHEMVMLSLCKYLFRMYSALGHVPGKHAPACRKLAYAIEHRILVFKAETQPHYADIPFDVIGYRLGQPVDPCVRTHTRKGLELIESILQRFRFGIHNHPGEMRYAKDVVG